MNPDPSNLIFSTDYQYFLNYGDADSSVTVASTSVPAGEAISANLVVPMTRTEDFTQVRVNFSHDSSKWYGFPLTDIALDANFTITTVGSYASNSLTLTFYVVNQTGSPANTTAFTATARSLLFVVPS